MSAREKTTTNNYYAQWRRVFLLVLIIVSAVSALLLWNAHTRNTETLTFQQHLLRGSVNGAAREIGLRIQSLRVAVGLFSEKERGLLKRLARDPENVDTYAELLKRIKGYFSDGFAVTLADYHGAPVVADFDGFVGQVCQADLRSYAQHAFVAPEIYIHPNAIGYHFDIMVTIDLNTQQPYVFFISFYPSVISSILNRHQLFGHRLMLLNRDVNGLIEVDSQGSRDIMNRDFFLSDSERARAQFSVPVAETKWVLVDMPDPGVQPDVGKAVWRETAVAIAALLLLSGYFLFSLRRHAHRIEVQNSVVVNQAGEIKERSRQLSDILERTTDAYLEFDTAWRCTYANRQSGKIIGQSPDAALGKDIWDAFPELAGVFFKQMQKARDDNVPYVFEGYYASAKRWLEMHMYPMPDRMTVFMRDVTQERLAWEQAKNSEVSVRAILDNVADAIITIDRTGRIESFNSAAERLFGYVSNEAIGQNVNIIVPGNIREDHDGYIERYRRTHKSKIIDRTRELVGQHKSGKTFPIELSVNLVSAPERDIFVGVLRDISERKENEDRVRAMAKFPDEDPAPVLRVLADGTVTYANRPAEFMLRAWESLVGGEVPAHIRNLVNDALEAAVPTEHELKCFDRTLSVVFSPIHDGGYVNLYGRDITDRKRVAEELKAHRDRLEDLVSERTVALVMAHNDALVASRAKSAFLASMSHELRTPLNAIIGYSELLIDHAFDEGRDDIVPDLRNISTAGKHLLTLINDILDLSKIESGKMQLSLENFLVSHVLFEIEGTIRPMVLKNNNRFDIVTDGEIGAMYSDATRLKQVLFNLLSNACKFTKNGRITLMVRRDVYYSQDYLSFVVNDTGMGMSSEQLDRLFQPFTQADNSIAVRYGGTGLGLAISRRLCELMGGTIRVHSDVGVGTSFTVQVPAEAAPQPELVVN